jgi:hypothetical protein
MLQNRGEQSRFKLETNVVNMHKILVKKEKKEKMEKIHVILEIIRVPILGPGFESHFGHPPSLWMAWSCIARNSALAAPAKLGL